jgi:uncharacterized protein (DUF1778 family)
MASAVTNQARIDFRATPDVKLLIERAAAICGTSVSEYIKATVVERSREVIELNETRVLSDRDRDLFLLLLDSPAPPNSALVAAAIDFKKAIEDGVLTP